MLKNKTVRVVLSAAFCVMLVFATLVAGCAPKAPSSTGSSSGASSGTSFIAKDAASQTYVLVTYDTGISYWKAAETGFQQAAAELGAKTQITGTPQEDASDEARILSTVASQHPAGIICAPVNATALNQTIDQIVASGIPVITYDSDAPQSNRNAFLGTDAGQAGSLAADTLAKLCNDQGNVMLEELTGLPTSDLRSQGFKTELAKYPNMHLVATENGKNDPELAAQQLGSLMQKQEIDGVFCTTANTGFGIATAVKEANKVGQVKIVSFDRDKETLDQIQAGVIQASMVQGSYLMGYWGLVQLYAIHNNLPTPLSTDAKAAGMGLTPPVNYTGIYVIDQSNYQKFESSTY